ncbi:hypothetical protein ACFXDE_28665 [Kitasatospora sp. NPDC059408]|uniref:hypothetical protein n=1 Tax=Kitasatospora sp. NPDC059408 TaxID=3346823 RepID=UPI0036911A56
MNGRLLRLLPARLLRRLGYGAVYVDQDALAAVLEADLDTARAGQPADLRKALERLTSPLEFQPGLAALHRETADTVVYLCNLVSASETHLDLHDPDQHRLYEDLVAAARAAEDLRLCVATATARTLPVPDTTTAELQHR